MTAWLGLATGAVAQEDGVTYDPDSPAGREYALPLESARDVSRPKPKASTPATTGAAGAPAVSDGDAALFGAGISEKRAPRRSPTSTPASGAESDDTEVAPAVGDEPAVGDPASISGGGSDDLRLGGGIAAAAAALALCLGALARRVNRRGAAEA